MSNEQEIFLFDDFFVPEEDEGIKVTITVKGREIPFTLKRGLTLKDKAAAQSQAIKKHQTPKGETVFDGFDESVYAIEMLARSLKAWPFVYSGKEKLMSLTGTEYTPKAGSPVPLNRININALLGDAADLLAQEVQKIMEGKSEMLIPFESPSEDHSSLVVVAPHPSPLAQ